MILSNKLRKEIEEEYCSDVDIEFHEAMKKRFDECYILIEEGREILVIHPYPANTGITNKIFLDTFEHIGPEDWEYAKEHGEVVTWQ